MRAFILAGLCALTLAACSGRAREPITDFGKATISTVEQNVVNQNELVLPPRFDVLPRPNPGGPNLADP